MRFHYSFIIKFEMNEKYITPPKGYKKRRLSKTLTVRLDFKISKRKTANMISLLHLPTLFNDFFG